MKAPSIPKVAPPPLPPSAPVSIGTAAGWKPSSPTLLTSPARPTATTQRRTLLGGL